jgi:hypothetical protein
MAEALGIVAIVAIRNGETTSELTPRWEDVNLGIELPPPPCGTLENQPRHIFEFAIGAPEPLMARSLDELRDAPIAEFTVD